MKRILFILCALMLLSCAEIPPILADRYAGQILSPKRCDYTFIDIINMEYELISIEYFNEHARNMPKKIVYRSTDQLYWYHKVVIIIWFVIPKPKEFDRGFK